MREGQTLVLLLQAMASNTEAAFFEELPTDRLERLIADLRETLALCEGELGPRLKRLDDWVAFTRHGAFIDTEGESA